MTTLAEHFELYDPARTSFELEPEKDAGLYVDVHGVLPRIRSILEATKAAPKLLVTGEYGMGKSHTLRHVACEMLPKLVPHSLPVFVKLGGLVPKATFLDVYRQIVQSLRGLLDEALRSLETIDPSDISDLSQDARIVLTRLHEALHEGESADRLGALRMWLSGSGPTPTQAMKLGLGTRLRDSSNHPDLVPLLGAIARLIHRASGRRVVLFLDESTAFRTPRGPEALLSISEGLRELFDQDNQVLGVILGMYDRRGGGKGLRLDVLQRMENRRVDLIPMRTPDEIKSFTRDLGEKVGRLQLFTPDAMSWFAQHAIEAGARSESPGVLSPRGLLKLLDRVGQEAHRAGVRPPLPNVQIQAWLPGRVA